MFAEASETRFLVQEEGYITICTIDAEEVEVDENDDNAQEKQGQVKINIGYYWQSDFIECNQE